MTELQLKIVAAVDAAGGRSDWLSLISQLEFQEQQRALNEIRALEVEGVLKRQIAWDAVSGTVAFTVARVG